MKNYLEVTAAIVVLASIVSGSGTLRSQDIFVRIQQTVVANPSIGQTNGYLYLFHITVAGTTAAQWTIDFKSQLSSVYSGPPLNDQTPDCTITVSDDDFVGLVTGQLMGPTAWVNGQLKVSGSLNAAYALHTILQMSRG